MERNPVVELQFAGAVIAEGRPPSVMLPNPRNPVCSRHPSIPLAGVHIVPDVGFTTRLPNTLLGRLDATPACASVADPSDEANPPMFSTAVRFPPCCCLDPPQGRPSASAVSVGGGQTFVPPADVVLSFRAESPAGDVHVICVLPDEGLLRVEAIGAVRVRVA